MKTWIALLRGVNVGGHHKLPMAALRTLLEELGLAEVQTLIQSGNVVFRTRSGAARTLAPRIADAIAEGFGFRPAVFVLEAAALARTLAQCPFTAADPATLQLFFLDGPAPQADLAAMAGACARSERFALRERVFYLHAPDGIGRSKLVAGVERWLGVATTARNGRTLRRLLDLAGY